MTEEYGGYIIYHPNWGPLREKRVGKRHSVGPGHTGACGHPTSRNFPDLAFFPRLLFLLPITPCSSNIVLLSSNTQFLLTAEQQHILLSLPETLMLLLANFYSCCRSLCFRCTEQTALTAQSSSVPLLFYHRALYFFFIAVSQLVILYLFVWLVI